MSQDKSYAFYFSNGSLTWILRLVIDMWAGHLVCKFEIKKKLNTSDRYKHSMCMLMDVTGQNLKQEVHLLQAIAFVISSKLCIIVILMLLKTCNW